MAYVTVDALQARFGAREIELLLDRDADGLPDTGTAEAAIADAGAEVDTLLGARYPIPLPATRWLAAAVADLARARLYDQQPPDAVSQRRDAVIARLHEIARREAVLLDDAGQPIAERDTGAAGGATHRAKRRVFDDDGLRGFL